MSTVTVRAPYEIGDKFQALFHDSERGTCLATFTVTDCWPSARQSDERALWTVRGVSGERIRSYLVRADGADRHGYVERV